MKFASCATGEDAVNYVRSTPCDVVLMDKQLPGIDGPEAASQIRALPEITQPKIVSLSAYTDEDSKREALAAGMDAVLSKPITQEALQQALAGPRDS